MFNVTPSSSAMHSLRQPSANGVTSTVFSSPHEQRISSTTGSVPDPLTLRLLPTGRAAPSRPFLLSTSQTLTRLCSQATHLPGHRHPQRQGGTEREPTARPRRIHQILAARRPFALGDSPALGIGLTCRTRRIPAIQPNSAPTISDRTYLSNGPYGEVHPTETTESRRGQR